MDDLQFDVLFSSISVYQGDMMMLMKGCVQWKEFRSQPGSVSGKASVAQ